MTTALMMRPAEVRTEINVDSGVVSEDERRQERLRCIQRRLSLGSGDYILIRRVIERERSKV